MTMLVKHNENTYIFSFVKIVDIYAPVICFHHKGWGIYIYVFGILKEMPHRGNAPTPKDSVVKIEEY